MKKGLSVIELLLAMTLIAIIAIVVSSIFTLVLRNYKTQTEKSRTQRAVNFVVDDIGKQIKLASAGEAAYDSFTRTQNPDSTLILKLPAQDASQNILYDGANPVYDYLVYYVNGNNLIRKTYATNVLSRKYLQDGQIVALISNVSSFSCGYSPNPTPEKISCNLEIQKDVGTGTVKVSAEKIATLRNKE